MRARSRSGSLIISFSTGKFSAMVVNLGVDLKKLCGMGY